jgi:Uma2 family endonuclease
MATATLASLSDYLRSSHEPDAEYANGHIEERPMGERDHSDLQLQILLLLSNPFHRTLVSAHPELLVQTTPTNYRVPDVCVLRAGAPREQIVRTPPLLCIEVLSPEDTMSRTMVRVREFLSMGVREVWVLDPHTRDVQVCMGATINQQHEGALTVLETPITLSLADIFRILDQT